MNTFYLSLTAVMGACWGSFLNAAYYRSLAGISLFHPPSHCPSCKKPIAPWLNVPVLGWFITRGKCHACRAPISIHYPLIEAFTALFFFACFLVIPDPLAASLVGGTFSLYALGAVYDHQKFQLPAITLYGAMLFSVVLVCLSPAAVDPKMIGTKAQAIANHLLGGAAITGALLAIKYVGQLFVIKSIPFDGKLTVTADGLNWEGKGEQPEFVTWDEFCFQKLVPHALLETNHAGETSPCANGEIEIHDGYVIANGAKVDLTKGPLVVTCRELTAYRNAMGMGDILLVPSLGTLLGFNIGLFEMFLVACVTGTAHGLYLKRKDRRLPFGPHLILATLYVLLSRYSFVPAVMTFFTPKH